MVAAGAALRRQGVPRPTGDILSLPRTSLPPILLVYLFCVVLQIGFQAGPIFLTTLRLLALAIVIPLTLNLLQGKYGRLIVTDFLFFAHLVWIGIALGVNNPDRALEQVGSTGVEFLGGYLVGRAYVRSAETFAALCRALVLFVLLLMPFAIYEAQTGSPIIIELVRSLPGVTSSSVLTIEGRMGFERVQATFSHPIHFGLFCSVAFSLTYVAMRGFISDMKRYVFSILILLTGLTALSSGALLAMVMQIGLIGWYTIFSNQAKRWWILVSLVALSYVTIDLLSNRSPLRVFMSYATFSAHNAYWRGIIFEWGLANIIGSAEKGITGSPLFGIGMGDWVRPHFMRSGSMDNFWLVMGVRYGLPGFLTLAIGYLLVIVKVMQRDFSNSLVLTQFRRAWVFTFLGLTFTLCTVHVWTNIYSFVTFMFGAGVWFITAQASERPEDGDEVDNARPRGPVFTRFDHSGVRGSSGPLVHARKADSMSRNRAANQPT